MYHKNKISITDKTLCTPITKTLKKPSIKLNNVIDNKLYHEKTSISCN